MLRSAGISVIAGLFISSVVVENFSLRKRSHTAVLSPLLLLTSTMKPIHRLTDFVVVAWVVWIVYL